MRVIVTEQSVEVRLAWWEKVLGLMRNVTIVREDISDVDVVQDPVREAMRAGMKVGLRLPWLLFVARTIRLDELFVVRRKVPGLSIAVRNHGALKRVLVSTNQAKELARRLQSSR
jgi:hypothetical protein